MADETLNHPAVKLARDTFKFCPNLGFRKEIIASAETNPQLWEQVVKDYSKPYAANGKQRHRNPLNWKAMLAEFDRRYFDRNGNGHR